MMNNSWSNLSCSSEDEFRKNIPVVIVFSIFSVTGVIGNSLIIFIYGFYFKETTTRVFILSLAVFDLITCATLPYKIILLRYGQLYENAHLARLEIVRIYFLQVSAMILPLVSIDRYRRICLPHKQQITPKIAKILVFTVSVILAAFGIFRMGVSSHELCYRAEAFISPDYLKDDVRERWINQFYFVYVILPFITPLPILISMYGLVGAKVRSLNRNSVSNPTHVPSRPKDTPPTRPLTSRNSDPEEAEVTSQTTKGKYSSQLNDMEYKERHDVDLRKKSRSVLVKGCSYTKEFRRNIYSMDIAQEGKTRSDRMQHSGLPNPVDIGQESSSNYDNELAKQRHDITGSHCVQSISSIDDSHFDVSITTNEMRTDVQSTSRPHNQGEGEQEGTTPSSDTRFPWKRMTFIFFLITVLYVISCIPFITLFIIFRLDRNYGHQLLSQGIFIVLYDFVYITVVSNCFLYGFFDPRFRRKLSLVKDKFIERVLKK